MAFARKLSPLLQRCVSSRTTRFPFTSPSDYSSSFPRFDSSSSFSSPSPSASPSVSESVGLVASVIVERLPIVLPDPPQWKMDYQKFSYELRQGFRKEFSKEFLDSASKTYTEEELTFEPASKITEADEKNDIRSVERKLDQRLYLIVKEKSKSEKWKFPEKIYENEDTMRMCAEKALESHIGNSLEIFFVGFAPCGHLHVPISNNESNRIKFYFRCQVLSGQIEILDKNVSDYAWLSKNEILNRVDPDEAKLFEKLLIQ